MNRLAGLGEDSMKVLKKVSCMALSVTLLGFVLCGYIEAFASEPVRPLSTDSRIKVVPYDANNVVPITLNLMTSTQFILNPDEQIIDVQVGDAAAWSFDNAQEPPNMFFIKPTMGNSNTNMTVITNKRSYYFHLMASPDISPSQVTYAIRVIYPEEEKLKMLREQAATLNLSKDPSVYNWRYSYNGSRAILPLHVFDDGAFTYLELQEGQPVPAVFAVDNTKGHESVVNFRRQGNYLVVERVAPQFTLRSGSYDVVSLFNDNAIDKARNGGSHG